MERILRDDFNYEPVPGIPPLRGVLDSAEVGKTIEVEAGKTEGLLTLGGDVRCARAVALVLSAIAGTGGEKRAVANITYGSASPTSVEVDIGAGTTVVLPASSITVTVTNEDTTAGNKVKVVGSVAYDSPAVTRVVRTKVIDTLGAGGNQIIALPPFASNVRIYRTSFATANFEVRVENQALGVLYNEVIAAGATCPTIQLANDATRINVFNGAVAGVRFRCVFELAM